MHIGGNGHTLLSVRHSAPVPSVTSHWLPCPHNPPYGHSSQCHSNADSGPWSVTVMSLSLSLCVCVNSFIYAYILESCSVCLSDCMCLNAFMHVFFLYLEAWWFFFFPPMSRPPKIWRCVAAVTEREETERVDTEAWGEVRRSSAAATGRGQRGWQCLLVASLSTWLCLSPASGQRRVAQHARRLQRGLKERLSELHGRTESNPS